MQLADFEFELPDELIASYPLEERAASRLLHLDRQDGGVEHKQFADLLQYLDPADLLVFNDTRVIPARLFGRKATGGRVEVLVTRVIDKWTALAMVRSSKPTKPGAVIEILDSGQAPVAIEILARDKELYRVRFPGEGVMAILESLGHMPLPPYIDRADVELDRDRYQTVYARRDGAVAAPTAGLHFDDAILGRISEAGIDSGFVTLHVGPGTFQPVRASKIEEHQMHSEYAEVSAGICQQVAECRARGGRVIAVGTTSVRSLESASASGSIAPFMGETDLFIYPGYEFKTIDALLTNFHLPGSTLIMLVSALCGLGELKNAYAEAVSHRYRFFSYGDAMLIS